MLRAPHFAHAALSEPLDETVAAKLARAADLLAERVDDSRADVGHDDDEQVREDDPEEELVSSGWKMVRPVRIMKPITTGHRADRRQRHQRAFRGGVGTTTVTRAAHTATQDSPIQPLISSLIGSMNSAIAMP